MKQSRNTQQRQLVQELLENNYEHPTADEVYELARKKNPKISRGTVYRNLNALVKKGNLLKVALPVGPDHFDFETHKHYHFLCRSCNRVLNADLPYNEKLNEATASIPGCKTEGHRLVLVGLCPDCNK